MIKKQFVFMCLFLTCFLIKQGFAFVLDEQVIATKDNACKMHYLTQKNIKGWYILPQRDECGADGWLEGYHSLTVYNAFSQPVEQLNGYFSQGYWTTDAWVEAPLLTRFSEELGVQKATFYIGEDSEREINYIGQMSAVKSKDGSYGGFAVCHPFKMLAVTKRLEVFADSHKRLPLFQDIEKQVRRFCPSEERVMLFASPVLEPDQSDIVFYSEIDLKTHTGNVVWQNEAWQQAAKTVEQISTLKQARQSKEKDRFRTELYDKIRQQMNKVTSYPQEIKNSVSFFSPEAQESIEEAKKDISLNHTTQDTFEWSYDPKAQTYTRLNEEELFKNTTSLMKEMNKGDHVDEVVIPKGKPYLYQPKNKSKNDSKTNETTKKQVQQEQTPVELAIHLFILSKIKKEPVLGTSIVEVSLNNKSHNKLVTSAPIEMTLNGFEFKKSGWYKVTGYFDAPHKKTQNWGSVDLIAVEECSTEQCRSDR